MRKGRIGVRAERRREKGGSATCPKKGGNGDRTKEYTEKYNMWNKDKRRPLKNEMEGKKENAE
jgi:hypothetical protein